MAEGIAAEISQTLEGDNKPEEVAATEPLQEDMDLDTQSPHDDGNTEGDLMPAPKRGREEEAANGTEEDDPVSKKLKSEKSVEEKRLEEMEEQKANEELEQQKANEELEEKKVNEGEEVAQVQEDNNGEEVAQVQEDNNEVEKEKADDEQGKESVDAVKLGPKIFSSSVDMFDYFFKLLHYWQPNIDINEYEYMALLDLLKKGHLEPDKKLGDGVNAFQVRYHPVWKSRCFFLIRKDGSSDDFSFRKCVDKILPLPDNMKAPASKGDSKKSGGHKKGGRGGHGHGHGKRGGYRR